MKKKIKYRFKHKKNGKRKFESNVVKKLDFILLLILLYSYIFINYRYEFQIIRVSDSIFQEIVSFENNLNLTTQIFDEFRQINCDNKLIEEKQKFKKSVNPDVSIIITMHNQAFYIHKGLRSVQNQSIKNIEIIIVDDCSLDNSLEIIKEYQKEDERIILISHDENEGKMKSRTDGIRKAKGKYITIIDGDDAFIHKDILKNSLYIAQKANLDVVEFRAGQYRNGEFIGILYDYNPLNVTDILYQPELREKFFLKDERQTYNVINRVIWGKFIKKGVFKELLNYIGSEIVDDYINESEDTLMAVGIFHIARSYYVMKEMGYYYTLGDKNKSIIIKNKVCKKMNDGINSFYFNYVKFLIDHHNKNDEEKINTYKEFLIYNFDRIFDMDLKIRHYQLIFYVLNELLKWDCLQQKEKERIIKYKNQAIEKDKKDNIKLFN